MDRWLIAMLVVVGLVIVGLVMTTGHRQSDIASGPPEPEPELSPPTPSRVPIPGEGFTLHIDAKKHINELPEFVVHHYCKNIDPQVIQCLLFDSDAPNAHVIGVETIISPAIYNQLPQEERASWHYHKDEIPLVDAKLPGLSEAQIQQVVAALENTYGRVVIFWVPGMPAPMGPPSVVNPHDVGD